MAARTILSYLNGVSDGKEYSKGQNGTRDLGNTKPNPRTRQISGKRWCFTLNNYTKEQMDKLKIKLGDTIGVIIGEECGESGTPHLQGYVEFSTQKRPVEYVGIQQIHWEKAKGTREDNVRYCSKENRLFLNTFKIRKPILDPLEGKELYPWQKNIIELCKNPPDNRQIYWYWESSGNTGKSSFAKHMFLKYNAKVVSGKGNDIKHIIAEHIKDVNLADLEIIIFDFPRSCEGYISFGAIEEIKNGLIVSGKYESCSLAFNIPHIFIFANFEPSENDMNKLSKDRWNIIKIS